ncbi:MAG: SDR family oxidoreductase [Pseudomonadota bacterium]
MHTINQLFDLEGKTALITGAASGLGYRFCEVLAQAGANVVGVARRKERLDQLQQTIGKQCTTYVCDLTDEAQLQVTLQAITEKHKIDILINAAGVADYTPVFAETTDETFEHIMNLNVTALWKVTKTVALQMKSKDIKGSIINIASINGDAVPAQRASAYCASKAAVIQLSKQLVGELSPFGIRINTISPGLFRTEMTENTMEKYEDVITKRIPAGFVADVQDMDGLILLLSSNKASRYINGANFVVDGGSSWGGHLESGWKD